MNLLNHSSEIDKNYTDKFKKLCTAMMDDISKNIYIISRR